jgi:hypothetical protein
LYTPIRRGTIILIAGIAILFLSFLVPWDMFLPPFQVEQRFEWQINPNVVGIFPRDLIWGTCVHGTIYCSGANDDIDFSITDSGDHVLFNPGRIYNGYKFRWQVPSNDIYHFKFDNTISWVTTKTVGYWIELYYYFHILLLVGTIATIVGVYFAVKGAIKMATKKNKVLCKHCGTMNLEGAIYCTECGKKIGGEPS